MKITPTISRYLAKHYVWNLLFLLLALFAVTYLFDVVELIRRASKYNDIPLSLILQMGLLKSPEIIQTLFPFAVLFSAMFTFWQLTKRYELVILRASGFSVWQFLTPIAGIAIFAGLLQMTIINPIGALFVSKYEQLQNRYLSHQENQIAVFEEGLWLRQAVLIESPIPQKKKDYVSGYVILHAQKVQQPEWILKNLTVLYFTDENDFLQRVDAQNAILKDGQWIFNEAVIHKSHSNRPLKEKTYELPTTLTVQDIEESFSSPESMSFWRLPGYIETLEQTGFDATRLRVYYQNLLSQPLMFAAMILLAAIVSTRSPRSKSPFSTIAMGILAGFIVFFMSSFLQALGSSGQIPVFMAAWSPSLICFLLGLTVILNLEDG